MSGEHGHGQGARTRSGERLMAAFLRLGTGPDLEAALRSKLRGEVRFDAGSRALYATDASNYRHVPIGVVIPRDVEDAVTAIAECRRLGVPVLPRGGGTSLAGQACNVAVVLDFTKYVNRVLSLDPAGRRAVVEPGAILDTLRDAANAHGLTFGPDPATHTHCTLGGMLGNDACGIHAQMAGRTSDNTLALDILTYDGCRMRVGPTSDEDLARLIAAPGRTGEIYRGLRSLRDRYADRIRERYPRIPRLVSGYALQHLLPENGFDVARALVGTEGTCVTILGAECRLVPWPAHRALVLLGYPDVYQAADHVPDVLACAPIGLEGMDDRLADFNRKKRMHAGALELLPPGAGWLIVQFGGDSPDEAADRGRELMERLRRGADVPAMRLYADPDQQEELWALRESGLGATAFVPGMRDAWPGWEDSAVPPERLGPYLRELRGLFDRFGYSPALYGHFGQGCVHCRIDFDLRTAGGIMRYRAFIEEAADLVVRHGGSLSGEHGDGQSRSELLGKMYGEDLQGAFREFKGIWDPAGKMNPGRLVDPLPLDESLRLGATHRPKPVDTYFAYPEDKGSFARATLRCVGVGVCRRESGGTMCPSYMVTREERDTTRGRANSLFEMLEGDVLRQGWRDPHVKEALDLCLSCKGCKRDCPVNVDMATYKAEFLAHYYRGRLRPPAAYSMGFIHEWGRLARHVPGLANLVTQTPGLRDLAKLVGGVAPQRSLPPFADRTFQAWFAEWSATRGATGDAAADRPRPPGLGPVLLWPDTFTNLFHPQIGRAAAQALERLGFEVQVPEGFVCCGRPLFEWGFLDAARARLCDAIAVLRPQLEAGTPILALEPSCASVFRDELPGLFPQDPDARRLAGQVVTLAELLEREAPDVILPKLGQSAIVHGHCHHKAIMTMEADRRVFGRLGLDARLLDSGCCGMAGSFGFERGERYEVGLKAGERVLLPEVRRTPPDVLLMTDGFSCREQIRQGTGRYAAHLAEVLCQALGGRAPERAAPARAGERPIERALLAGGAALLGFTLVRASGLVGRRLAGRGGNR